MFTGIIDHCGRIAQLEKRADTSITMSIETQFTDLILGESIAVDGICLTVTQINTNNFQCDISPETLQRTTATSFAINKRVNLERALRLSDRLGGHFVMGHVDECGHLLSKQIHQEFIELRFQCSTTAQRYLIDKGSIAVNGVSLTLNQIHTDGFSVMCIPHTLALTNLADLVIQETVNLEYDWMAKLLVKQFIQMSINS